MKKGTRLYINITNRCNTRCPFCCMYSGEDKTTDKKHFLRRCWVTLSSYGCDYIFPGDNLIKRGEIYIKRK
ncbi:MAG: hypothetical protein IJH65_08585 [Methanobrevibacter sp.]|nr:hypothetical protein [Methanobrevibacter sp.]